MIGPGTGQAGHRRVQAAGASVGRRRRRSAASEVRPTPVRAKVIVPGSGTAATTTVKELVASAWNWKSGPVPATGVVPKGPIPPRLTGPLAAPRFGVMVA